MFWIVDTFGFFRVVKRVDNRI